MLPSFHLKEKTKKNSYSQPKFTGMHQFHVSHIIYYLDSQLFSITCYVSGAPGHQFIIATIVSCVVVSYQRPSSLFALSLHFMERKHSVLRGCHDPSPAKITTQSL